MLAVFLLIYSAIAGRIERSLISGPIVFTAVGFILGAEPHSCDERVCEQNRIGLSVGARLSAS